MPVTYAITNNYGPGLPSVDYTVNADPTQPATPEGTPANTDVTNTARTQMAVQVYNVTDQHYFGTPPPKTSHSGGDVW